MSGQNTQRIRIKPSLVPFTWKGFLVILLGVMLYVAVSFFRPTLPSPLLGVSSLLNFVFLGIVGLGLLVVLIGVVRRNTYTYQLTDSDLVIQKQFLRRNVRRIPFVSMSDVEISQSLAGRLVGYGNIVPITKSGYGLVKGMDPTENTVSEMTNVPNPDEVASLIMSRASLSSGAATGK